MAAGGFDAVIGNPPYVLLQDAFRDDEQLAYFRSVFSVASYKLDTYHLFVEHAVRLIAQWPLFDDYAGQLPDKQLPTPLRRFLLEQSAVDHIVVIDGGVFRGVSVDNSIFVLVGGGRTSRTFPVFHAVSADEGLRTTHKTVVSATAARKDEHALFTEAGDAERTGLWNRILAKGVLLGNVACVNFGKQLRDRKKYPRDVVKVERRKDVSANYAPCYTGRDVFRYRLAWGNLACLDDDVAQCGGCWNSEKQNAKIN